MVPAAGERFTWTLKTFRKMLILVCGSPSISITEMSVTLPSAGETIAPSNSRNLALGITKKP